MQLESFLKLFKGIQKTENPKQFKAKCPAHEDNKPSLSISEGRFADRIILKCFAGCDADRILSAVGKSSRDLFYHSDQYPAQAFGYPVVAIYDYRDKDGSLKYQVIRNANKDFPQRHIGPDGQWVWKGPEKKLLYRLPDLIAADPKKVVFVPEGEKDVDNLYKLGLIATCNSGGGGRGKWNQDSSALAGRTILILPDNDGPGEIHAACVAIALKKIGCKVYCLKLPGLPSKGDVTDWIAAGGTREALLELAKDITRGPEFSPRDDGSGPAAAGSGPAAAGSGPATGPAAAGSRLPHKNDSVFQASSSLIFPDNLDLMGFAAKFHFRHFLSIRYIEKLKVFLWYDGQCWDYSEQDAHREIKIMINEYEIELATIRDEIQNLQASAPTAEGSKRLLFLAGREEALAKFLKELKKTPPMSKILTFLASDIRVDLNKFDSDPDLFNCANGTFNLKTGELQPHDGRDLCTLQGNVSYDPAADCPKWKAALRQIFLGKEDVIKFYQTWLGYLISGHTFEQKMAINYGTGANGKGLVERVIRRIMGSYGGSVGMDAFYEKTGNNSHSEEIAVLFNRRLASLSEGKANRLLDEALIKTLVGQDTILTSRKFQPAFEFTPQFKIVLSTNHKPALGTDHGTWRRLLLFPFEARFCPAAEISDPTREFQIDPSLETVLLEQELSGILNWIIEGNRTWQKEGLGKLPHSMASALVEYQEENDRIKAFLAEILEQCPDARVSFGDVYREYAQWSDLNGYRKMSNTSFSKEMARLKIEIERVRLNGKPSRCLKGYQFLPKAMMN